MFVESTSTNIDLVLWASEFPWMLCALRCLAPPQCWQSSWTWRIFDYDDPHNVEITRHLTLHFLPPIKVKMEILREFLESSTIHGLSYISSSKVKPIKELFNTVLIMSNTVLIICMITITCWWSPSDQDCKDPLVWHCLSRFHRCWNPNWQVLQGVAGLPHCHLRHHPSHRRSRLPCRVCLSSKGLQHSSLSRSCRR